ncbi:hypothetical protein STAQ_20020 [Allostella sp. ATCC 35155]|nr:hypothetical protein STAQ_20020 [Stella sp. ATCC 35155]
MRYRLAPRAVADLEEITDYVAAENPQAARWLLVAIERRFEQLASQPWSGVARDDIAPGIRHLVAGRYLALYRVTDDDVVILRILHGRRRIGTDSVAKVC